MAILRLSRLITQSKTVPRPDVPVSLTKRTATTTPTGAILPEPEKTPFGIFGIVCAVVPGLLIGAAISKNIANFLEENELFVPSDDDDDDD
ncbi:Essential MCU regulator, mitochondrial [Eumeta japonica]|uniref:Essential MCU regulator, mitochondrial n=1 Tax=Eumeta variegata TaxID=151549 RepID=A0A4C1V693_EUMVA|nr:Essential MCU regulator, mitochondrial [Eumeta japonica]